MKAFSVEREAQLEFDAAAAWYEREREGLGFEFIEEVDRSKTGWFAGSSSVDSLTS